MSFILLIFFIKPISASSLNEKLNSLPEFECTVTQVEQSKKNAVFKNLRKHQSFSLRKGKEKWLLDWGKESYNLNGDRVLKTADLVSGQTQYSIELISNMKINLNLAGQSPSRTGKVMVQAGLQTVYSGEVTCH